MSDQSKQLNQHSQPELDPNYIAPTIELQHQTTNSNTSVQIQTINNNHHNDNNNIKSPIEDVIDDEDPTRLELQNKLYSIFKRNRKLPPSPLLATFCYQFENLPAIQSTCGYPFENQSLYNLFYTQLVDTYLPHHLKPLKNIIQSSKLFISVPAVLNGQWIQFQGEGAVLDIDGAILHDFVKDGDNTTPFTPCDSMCTQCYGKPSLAIDTTVPRFLIKFKWE